MIKILRRYARTAFLLVALAGAFLESPRLHAAESVTTTVIAVGTKNTAPPAIKKDDIQLYQGRERVQVADWRRGESLFLAVLIDDTLEQTVAHSGPT